MIRIMLALLIATGTLEKLAWVVVALLVVIVGGGAVARLSSSRDRTDRGHDTRHDVDASFRKPPNEGGLL